MLFGLLVVEGKSYAARGLEFLLGRGWPNDLVE